MLSPEALALLKGDHTAISKVEVWRAGKPVAVLMPISGGVSVESGSPIRRSLQCQLVDPTGAMTQELAEALLPDTSAGDLVGGNVGDLLNAYECEIVPYRGVRVPLVTNAVLTTLIPNQGFGIQPFGTSGFGGYDAYYSPISSVEYRDEYVRLGVFRLTGRDISDGPNGLTISLKAQDRSIMYQTTMSRALPVNAYTPVEVAIRMLLGMVNPGISLVAMNTGHTVGPLLFQPTINVWTEAQKLAQSVGANLYHDRNGQAVLAPMGATSDFPVAEYIEGEGTLLDVKTTEDSDTINNVVVAESEDGSVRVIVEDSDPASPTFSRGKFRRVFTLKNPYFGGIRQALEAAIARLTYELGRTQKVSITATVDPTRDVDEVIVVHRPRSKLFRRSLLVANVDIPLAVDDSMAITCRESRTSANGQVLADPKEMAA